MGDPLNMYNGNGSRKRERKDDEEYEEYDEFDESNDGYIKVKINKTKILGKVSLLEKQNKVLKTRLQDVMDETLALRENNVKFQVEIFRLRRKISEMQSGDEPRQSNYADDKYSICQIEEIQPEDPQPIKKSPRPKKTVPIKKPVLPDKKPNPSKSIPNGSSSEDTSEEDEKLMSPTVLKNFKDIKLSKTKQKDLDDIPPGPVNDSKYICKILTYLFDVETLFGSSVTGKAPKRPGPNWGIKPLDPIRIRYLRYAFNKRLDKESLNSHQRFVRGKKINVFINNKINNIRKCRFRKVKQNDAITMVEECTILS